MYARREGREREVGERGEFHTKVWLLYLLPFVTFAANTRAWLWMCDSVYECKYTGPWHVSLRFFFLSLRASRYATISRLVEFYYEN